MSSPQKCENIYENQHKRALTLLVSEFLKDFGFIYSDMARKVEKHRRAIEADPENTERLFVKMLDHMNKAEKNCDILFKKLSEEIKLLNGNNNELTEITRMLEFRRANFKILHDLANGYTVACSNGMNNVLPKVQEDHIDNIQTSKPDAAGAKQTDSISKDCNKENSVLTKENQVQLNNTEKNVPKENEIKLESQVMSKISSERELTNNDKEANVETTTRLEVKIEERPTVIIEVEPTGEQHIVISDGETADSTEQTEDAVPTRVPDLNQNDGSQSPCFEFYLSDSTTETTENAVPPCVPDLNQNETSQSPSFDFHLSDFSDKTEDGVPAHGPDLNKEPDKSQSASCVVNSCDVPSNNQEPVNGHMPVHNDSQDELDLLTVTAERVCNEDGQSEEENLLEIKEQVEMEVDILNSENKRRRKSSVKEVEALYLELMNDDLILSDTGSNSSIEDLSNVDDSSDDSIKESNHLPEELNCFIESEEFCDNKYKFLAYLNLIKKGIKIERKASPLENCLMEILRNKFNAKELSVNVARCPELTERLKNYRPRRSTRNRRLYDDIDRLCDLNTILRKNLNTQKQKKKKKVQKLKKDIIDLNFSSGSELSLKDFDFEACNSSNDDKFLESIHRNIISESEENTEDSDSADSVDSKRKNKKRNLSKIKRKELSLEEKRKKSWRNDSLLTGKLSTSDSSSSSDEDSSESTQIKKKGRYEYDSEFHLSSDSFPNSDCDSLDLKLPNEEKTVNNKLAKDENNLELLISDDEDSEHRNNLNTSADILSTPKGRKNIRALVSDENLAVSTRKAKQAESERIERLKQNSEKLEKFSQETEDSLILDVHNDHFIKIHPTLCKRMKPHQVDGVKFMWNSCYESINGIQEHQGTGCILAHSMGLGKTFQVVTLIHTLFKNCEQTNTNHVLIVSPLSVILNWKHEFNLAFKLIQEVNMPVWIIGTEKYSNHKLNTLKKWRKHKGVLIMGYSCFEKLINDKSLEKHSDHHRTTIIESLINPGPDLIICDEGHLLRSKNALRTIALNKVSTKRRIVLTGTPLQNNLKEYYHMVQFVKPNLLGTIKEYTTNFVNPIHNGQFEDCTTHDIRLMKNRTHVLCELLKDTIQRKETTELQIYLPKLRDYAVFVKLDEIQASLYKSYLDMVKNRKNSDKGYSQFFSDCRILSHISSHPYILKLVKQKKMSKNKESEMTETEQWLNKSSDELGENNLKCSNKFLILKSILQEAESVGDKVLIFSQYRAEMDCIEHFLKIHGTQGCPSWQRNKDYVRMDGTVTTDVRNILCKSFNSEKNPRLRLFILSHQVGGLGINLTAANRVINLGVNFNPSYDTQSVFRAYRFGQKKDCFVYRLMALGTMEEKMYHRSITKLAVSSRVVDKRHITRHYKSIELQEIFDINLRLEESRLMPNVPEDTILAKIISKHDCIFKYHEHQALLENRPEEELNEFEKNMAWEEFNKINKAVRKILPNESILKLNNISKNVTSTSNRAVHPRISANLNLTSTNIIDLENIIPHTRIDNNDNTRQLDATEETNSEEVILIESDHSQQVISGSTGNENDGKVEGKQHLFTLMRKRKRTKTPNHITELENKRNNKIGRLDDDIQIIEDDDSEPVIIEDDNNDNSFDEDITDKINKLRETGCTITLTTNPEGAKENDIVTIELT